jgi:diguanylate cyclase
MTICQLEQAASCASTELKGLLPTSAAQFAPVSGPTKPARLGGLVVNQHERAQALAKSALALMAERQVSPTPENFQLFYAYASGENPIASRVMGEMIVGRRPFSSVVLDDLRERFFGTAHLETTVQNIGAEITGAMDSVLQKLANAEKDTVAYGRTLSAASGELGGGQTPAEMQKLVDGLLGATQAMEVRTKALEEELQRSSYEVNDLKTKLDDVRKESLTDPLTGIHNRKAFDQELAEAVDLARRDGEPLSLFMCDIDHFKVFNDTWGHQTGDQVLRLVGHCLSENVKGRDTAARYGGEEFAVILRQTGLESAVSLANQIRSNVEGKKLVKRSTGDILGTITISIGVAQLGLGEPASSLIQRADACLYAAKNAGRNRVMSEAPTAMSEDVVAA